MTSTIAVDLINNQIAQELEKLNAFMTFESEKPKILARISELTKMLPNQQQTPSRKETMAELVELIILEANKETGKSLREICDTIVARTD